MLRARVIPCLLLQNGGLVKTRRFASPTYLGDPVNAIRIFNEKQADELMVLDIAVSKEGRGPDFSLIEQFAGECFMPLSYGGGVRSVEDAQRLFALGVEKVCVQSAAIADSTLIGRLSERFGSCSVVASVDVGVDWRGRRRLRSAALGRFVSRPWKEFLQSVVAEGAGEVLLTSVSRDGMMGGMDLELIRDAVEGLPVPLVASGGAGSLGDMAAALQAGASAVGVGAYFVFQGPHRAVLITYPSEQEVTALWRVAT